MKKFCTNCMTEVVLTPQGRCPYCANFFTRGVKTYDEISLLDLAHTLRIWTELKKPLQDVAPEFSNSISFKTGSPTPRVLKAARGSDNVFCYMPGGVVTFANKGHLAQGPGTPGSAPWPRHARGAVHRHGVSPGCLYDLTPKPPATVEYV